MSAFPVKFRKVILPGEFDKPETSDDLLEVGARVLDKACLWDSVGDHLFQGEDGKLYIMAFEAHVGEASMTYAKQLIQQAMDGLDTDSAEYKELRQLLFKQVKDAVAILNGLLIKYPEQPGEAVRVCKQGGRAAEAIQIILPDWNEQDYKNWSIDDVINYPHVHPEMYEAQL